MDGCSGGADFSSSVPGFDALGISGLVLVVADPSISRDMGFQLSSLAVVGLLWAGANDRSTFLSKASSLRTSLSATLMSTPLIAEGFGVAALVGGTLSIVVLPVVTYWIAPGIILLILLWYLEQPIAEPLVSLLELGVATINAFRRPSAICSEYFVDGMDVRGLGLHALGGAMVCDLCLPLISCDGVRRVRQP